MSLSEEKKEEIKTLISEIIEKKLEKYSPESSYMPFLTCLLQDSKRVASYSFTHSLATSLGTSFYEQVSTIILNNCCDEVCRQYPIKGDISKSQKTEIDSIVTGLGNGQRTPNIEKETNEVLRVQSTNGNPQDDGRIADLYMKRDGEEHFFEIKTAKPNKGGFKSFKIQLLEWVARKQKKVKVYLAIPYNPYHPKPYERFTMKKYFKLGEDALVGEQYWTFIGGEGTYEDLLEVFDEIGKFYKKKISVKLKEVSRVNVIS
ncbi:MAG: TdeIII family type II restriction endonuclease [Candidatus Mycalebacterium zealandia]|nr:MAG: TdeIII family type II restriction endonuclease [Candidatus Mycalebacterium zealandia]